MCSERRQSGRRRWFGGRRVWLKAGYVVWRGVAVSVTGLRCYWSPNTFFTRSVAISGTQTVRSTHWLVEPVGASPGKAPKTEEGTRHSAVYRIHEFFVHLPGALPKIPSLAGSWRAAGQGWQWVAKLGGGWPRRRGLQAPATPMESI
ncbi:hypothetical protein E2C01_041037 [Portunus trituberculatus]|uniref:Uncharacterized protein n=1 Tax=Portunus trituberculatus TaxID=210409 RepID=A0A5B7FP81_PORTR|nr:hypothetical protein [Portunus trituberculatus]